MSEVPSAILHIDMDCFFASVEVAARPELVGLPVAVAGGARSVVVAATYEARAYGVRAAMPLGQAKRLCERLIVVHPRHDEYRRVSAEVMSLISEFSPVMEQVSIDEAFLDVSGAGRRLGSPEQIAVQIREQIRQATGLAASVGIGRNKSVAKISSGMAKPDGIHVVPAADTVAFLHALPVERLWGVGPSTARRLHQAGLVMVADIAASGADTLKHLLGSAGGAKIYDLAWGRDDRQVAPRIGELSIGHERTFDVDLRSPEDVKRYVRELADAATSRLRSKGKAAGTVAVKVRDGQFHTLNRSRTLSQPTDVAAEVYAVAWELVLPLVNPRLGVRLVGVRLENLKEPDEVATQPTFDDLETKDTADTGDRRAAERAVDAIRERYGSSSVSMGTG